MVFPRLNWPSDRLSTADHTATRPHPLYPSATASCDAALSARVIGVDRERYTVSGDFGEAAAKLSGRLRFTDADRPCVGDRVLLRLSVDEGPAVIIEVLPRTSFLRRKHPGRKIDHQLIAANLDLALIVQSCVRDFNVARLERYLVAAHDGGVAATIVLSKTDLIDDATLAERIGEIRRAGIDAPIIALSNATGLGFDELRRRLPPGSIGCLLGSSGVGKSTLINRLAGDDAQLTAPTGRNGKGRHTTTRRQWIELPNGVRLIDTPGMRELGLVDAEAGLEVQFSDIHETAVRCRFSDCTHSGEPGCAVLKAIDDRKFDAGHLDNFRKLDRESAFNALSYAEKRRKDRAFGRVVKSALKAKGKLRES